MAARTSYRSVGGAGARRRAARAGVCGRAARAQRERASIQLAASMCMWHVESMWQCGRGSVGCRASGAMERADRPAIIAYLTLKIRDHVARGISKYFKKGAVSPQRTSSSVGGLRIDQEA